MNDTSTATPIIAWMPMIIIILVIVGIFVWLFRRSAQARPATESQKSPQSNQQPDSSIPDDPYVSDQESMMNGQAWVWRSELDKSIEFILSGGRITGIWLAGFPTNARKRTVMHLFCVAEQKREPSKEAAIERVVDKIYDDEYDIRKNPTKGGFDVIFR
jgi:Na+/H+ antiporter NhaC